MSCEADFTDRSLQRAKNSPVRCGQDRASRLRAREDIEIANAKLKAAIEDIVESLDCAYSLFEDCEQDPKNADRISISMRSLEVLKREQEEAEAAIAAVFKDHGWELRRAMRAFSVAIVRGKAA